MKKKILIIEDDNDILDITTLVLNMADYEVIGSNGTDDIIALVKTHQPDLVLTDYMLPGLTGGQICKLIKNHKDTAKIPVILMSAYQRQAIDVGNFDYDAYIKKPYNVGHLVSVMNKFTAN
ncbi:PleD family two-component system response regulator [Mucilaginibacter lutimaris]|uniref:PleD family two-component system response regulator n=1 Tax=Mucilaginibacter lutimaris TaxID=931629 RepID=A0ABW2ZLI2_9SPHI